MNVDVQIYLSNFKSFFNNNPNDLINLIGDGDKDKFFELVEGTVIENYDKGEDLELTKKQLIDIMLILTKDRVEEKVENFILKGPYGDIFLN
jgi:hypothetical protein|tara:strand:- start:85 stop:360 length:276 start_codon:yes stop_codon:yes gene_type:complete